MHRPLIAWALLLVAATVDASCAPNCEDEACNTCLAQFDNEFTIIPGGGDGDLDLDQVCGNLKSCSGVCSSDVFTDFVKTQCRLNTGCDACLENQTPVENCADVQTLLRNCTSACSDRGMFDTLGTSLSMATSCPQVFQGACTLCAKSVYARYNRFLFNSSEPLAPCLPSAVAAMYHVCDSVCPNPGNNEHLTLLRESILDNAKETCANFIGRGNVKDWVEVLLEPLSQLCAECAFEKLPLGSHILKLMGDSSSGETQCKKVSEDIVDMVKDCAECTPPELNQFSVTAELVTNTAVDGCPLKGGTPVGAPRDDLPCYRCLNSILNDIGVLDRPDRDVCDAAHMIHKKVTQMCYLEHACVASYKPEVARYEKLLQQRFSACDIPTTQTLIIPKPEDTANSQFCEEALNNKLLALLYALEAKKREQCAMLTEFAQDVIWMYDCPDYNNRMIWLRRLAVRVASKLNDCNLPTVAFGANFTGSGSTSMAWYGDRDPLWTTSSNSSAVKPLREQENTLLVSMVFAEMGVMYFYLGCVGQAPANVNLQVAKCTFEALNGWEPNDCLRATNAISTCSNFCQSPCETMDTRHVQRVLQLLLDDGEAVNCDAACYSRYSTDGLETSELVSIVVFAFVCTGVFVGVVYTKRNDRNAELNKPVTAISHGSHTSVSSASSSSSERPSTGVLMAVPTMVNEQKLLTHNPNFDPLDL